MFPVARAVLLSMRASEDLGRAEKLSAAEQVKSDCCHTPAVVSTLLTPLPVSCPLTTPHHYTQFCTESTLIFGFLEAFAWKQKI